MNYTATVTSGGDAENVKELFESEDKELMGRASYEVEQEGDEVVFRVEADDATALRAALDAISRALKIYESMKEVD